MNDSTNPNVVASHSGALSAYLSPVLEQRSIVLDPSQLAALGRLTHLHDEFAAFVRARRSLLRRWFNPPIPPRGVYLWGGVGRGKSFLMDAFYAAVPLRRKTRVHFHAFMKSVHDELRTLTHSVDPLDSVAARIARRHRLVCFDEFHVSDVAGVTKIPGGTVPRLRAFAPLSCFCVLPAGAAEAELGVLFDRMQAGPDENPRLNVEARGLKAKRRAGGVVWFGFATLCEGPRSQVDYLELARRFAVVIVSDVPRLSADMGNAARRFSWLVDVIYDNRVKLLLWAAVLAAEL
jgi:cell division protein ZapE